MDPTIVRLDFVRQLPSPALTTTAADMLFRSMYMPTISREVPTAHQEFNATLASQGESAKYEYYGMHLEESVIAVSALHVSGAPRRIKLAELVVAREHQGRGYGRRMVEHLEHRVRSIAQGASTMLYLAPAVDEARPGRQPKDFYRHLGYEWLDLNEIYMKKDL